MAIKKSYKIIMIIIPVLAVVLGAAYVVFEHVPASTYAVQQTDGQAAWGSINGSLSYPSEGIPPMGVCAKSVTGQDMFCTYKAMADKKYTYGYGYELAVPPDTYYVFAHLVSEGREKIGYVDEYKAYYSDFVTCGLAIDCQSHKPIPVKIKSNQNVQDIDPADWYNQFTL